MKNKFVYLKIWKHYFLKHTTVLVHPYSDIHSTQKYPYPLWQIHTCAYHLCIALNSPPWCQRVSIDLRNLHWGKEGISLVYHQQPFNQMLLLQAYNHWMMSTVPTRWARKGTAGIIYSQREQPPAVAVIHAVQSYLINSNSAVILHE